jgi:hypothetical protein
MTSIRLIPNFAARYPDTPSAEERRAAYIMLTGYHMFLPEGVEREAYSHYLQHHPLQPHLGSRTTFLAWASGCIRECCRDDSDVRRQKRREAEAVAARRTQQFVTLGVLVGLFGIVYGADKL